MGATPFVHALAMLWMTWFACLVPSTVAAATSWAESLKECKPGCTKRGNCNAETATCMCPYGYAGDVCERGVLDACRASPHGRPTCSITHYARSCACYSQCRKVHCENELDKCDMTSMTFDLPERLCYQYPSGHPHHRWSVFPEYNDTVVEWRVYKTDHWEKLPLENLKKAVHYYTTDEMVPLHYCPESCRYNGGCYMTKTNNFVCACFKGALGPSCESKDDSTCYNNCNGRGECVHGFCHCKHGYWGIDCSRSKAYAPLPHQKLMLAEQAARVARNLPPERLPGPISPVRHMLRVYVYDLPWHVAHNLEFDTPYQRIDPIYTAFEAFFSQVIRDPSVRTENPYEANLYYVPLLSYYYTGNIDADNVHMRLVISHIKTNYPFWNRTGGRDHVFWLGGDTGTCGQVQSADIVAPIRVVHFGFLALPETLGFHAGNFSCVTFFKDVVAPPWVDIDRDSLFDSIAGSKAIQEPVLRGEPPAKPRKTLLFFAGGLRIGNPRYSGGARQAVYELTQFLAKNNDSRVAQLSIESNSVPNYFERLSTSKFCLAPYGHGWGIRLGQAILYGCVPIIIQDAVAQPLETVLPYHKFSIRLTSREVVKNLLDILEAVSEEQLKSMQLEMAKIYRAFLWDIKSGGLAYNYTLQALHASLTHMWLARKS